MGTRPCHSRRSFAPIPRSRPSALIGPRRPSRRRISPSNPPNASACRRPPTGFGDSEQFPGHKDCQVGVVGSNPIDLQFCEAIEDFIQQHIRLYIRTSRTPSGKVLRGIRQAAKSRLRLPTSSQSRRSAHSSELMYFSVTVNFCATSSRVSAWPVPPFAAGRIPRIGAVPNLVGDIAVAASRITKAVHPGCDRDAGRSQRPALRRQRHSGSR